MIVEESQGLDNLESLQHHDSERIYQLAYKIVDEFFNDAENENINIESTNDLKVDNNTTDGKNLNFTNTTFNF